MIKVTRITLLLKDLAMKRWPLKYHLFLRLKDITKNSCIFFHDLYITRMPYCRHLMKAEEWSLPRNTFWLSNFVSQEKFPVKWKISFHLIKFPVTVRNLISQEWISCDRTKFPVTGQGFRGQKILPAIEKYYSTLLYVHTKTPAKTKFAKT